MANTVLSPVMSMPVPVPTVDPGPQYAFDLNSCLSILDQHDHTVGLGNPITPSAMLINADLLMGSNNLTAIRSTRFDAQLSPLALGTDLGCLYVSGVDLWYNDENGNQIQITALGGVSGTPGSIANLVPPASASYVSGSKTFVFQSNVNQAANLDGASVILRNIPGTNGLTLSPPALGSNYTITLPTLPGAPSFLTIDNLGNMGDAIPLSQGLTGSNIANATITGANIAASTIEVGNMDSNSVGTAQLIANSVTPDKLSTFNLVDSGGSGSFVTNSTSGVDVVQTPTIITSGRAVLVTITASSGTSPSYLSVADSVNPPIGFIYINRNGTDLTKSEITSIIGGATAVPASISFVDPTAGASTYFYKIRAQVVSGTTNFSLFNVKITAYEL